MRPNDFTTMIQVDQTPREVFDAINNVRAWWSESIEGNTANLNDEYFYHYKDVHLCKMKLIESIPGRRVVWLVLDNFFKFTNDKSEWKGTKVIFDITTKDGRTSLLFTHEGLVPQYECYEICREAWTGYIQDSLFKLITTGKGKPNTRDIDGFNAQLVEKWKLAS
jgi:hypothetical protein